MTLRAALLLSLALTWPVQAFDDAARDWALSCRRPSLAQPMRVASDKARVVLIAGAAAGLLSGPTGRLVVGEAAIVLIPVNLVVEALKYATNRTRPDGTRKRSNSAFPSSHSANAFAIATVLARRWRRGAPVFFAYAALVAFSRMYLDRHWASDVLAGAVLATLIAWFAGKAFERWRAGRVLASA
jgi:membrane-associated phospholipid phosphatase